MFGLCNLAGLVDAEGHVSGATATYLAASAGTALGALTGTTPLIIAAESAVGEPVMLQRQLPSVVPLTYIQALYACPKGWA